MLQAGKMQEVAEELNKLSMDITAVQEIRWKGAGRIDKSQYTLLFSGNQRKQGERGVGFILNKHIRRSLMSFEPINDRLCKVRIRGKFYHVTLVSAYAPTEKGSEDDIEQFYTELQTLCDRTPAHDALLILGDFNAKVGKEDVWRNVAGRYSLHDETSDNGERLCSLASSTNLIIKSTCFPHKRIHLGTWMMPGYRALNQIDHVLINKRRASSITDVRTMRGANCDSDHYLVRSIFRQRIATNTNKHPNSATKWNLEALKVDATLSNYQNKLAEMLEQSNGQDIEDEWNNIKTIIIEATKDTIGERRKARNDQWYDEECQRVTDLKNKARSKALQIGTRANRMEYERLRNIARKIYRKKKREFEKENFKKLDYYNLNNQSRKFYRQVEILSKEYKPRLNVCKDVNGVILTEQDKIIKRWEEHFSSLLNQPVLRQNLEFIYHSVEPYIDAPTYEEVVSAIQKQKNHKSPGSDNICSELFKYGGDAIWKKLHTLIQKIWREEQMPKEWKNGIICPIHKKGDKTQCGNYRGITLLNNAYKILSSVIYNRLAVYAEDILGEYQAGFRRNRSTVDHIHTMRQMLEKCYEHNINLHNLFVDYKQAFDTIDRMEMLNRFKLLGIPYKLTNLVAMTLEGSTARVRIERNVSEAFTINSGVRQGDALSALLFILTMESVIRQININGSLKTKNTQLLAYADDIVITSKNRQGLEEAFSALQTNSAQVGLIVNQSKTMYMFNSRVRNQVLNDITLNGQHFKHTTDFCYLGSQMNEQNLVSLDIQARIASGYRASFAYNKLLRSKTISRASKIKIYKTLIRPIVTYACETWTLKQADITKLSVFERRILRKIFGPTQENCGSWRIKMNYELENLMHGETIVRFIKFRRLQWFGHLYRMSENRLPIQFTNWTPFATRSRGRPRKKWKTEVLEDIKKLKIKNWVEEVRSRAGWNRLVQQAKTHPGL